jgi:hypothetical protein
MSLRPIDDHGTQCQPISDWSFDSGGATLTSCLGFFHSRPACISGMYPLDMNVTSPVQGTCPDVKFRYPFAHLHNPFQVYIIPLINEHSILKFTLAEPARKVNDEIS